MLMTAYLMLLRSLLGLIRDRLRSDEGWTLELMLLVGLLASAALAAGGYLVKKIMEHAHQIQ
jgi:hypothetical protein